MKDIQQALELGILGAMKWQDKGRRGRTSRRRTVVHSGREGQAIQAGGGVLHEGSDATIAIGEGRDITAENR